MTRHRKLLIYTIAFDPPGSTARRDQARVLLQSLRTHGFGGPLVLFANTVDPLDVPRLETVVIPHDNFDRDRPTDPRNGKLPSCRFRFRAPQFMPPALLADVQRLDGWILYLDTDMVCRRPLDGLLDWMVSDAIEADMIWTPVRGRSMHGSRWFGGHLSHEEEVRAAVRRGGCPVQGGSTAFRARTWPEVCAAWDVLDRQPVRHGPFAPTDQSSQNKFVLQCEQGWLPWRTQPFPDSAILSPRREQIRRFRGHDYLDATFYHYWGFGSEAERTALAAAELHQRMSASTHPIVGAWRHTKPAEGISNIWRFAENGRVTVSPGSLTGEWQVMANGIHIQWPFGGWEVVYDRPIGESTWTGYSYKGGHNSFTLSADSAVPVPLAPTISPDEGDAEGDADVSA